MEFPLKHLTLDDRALLTEASSRVWYSPGDVILEQGQTRQALLTICSGMARIEVGGVPVGLLGAGAIVGEMSFVGRMAATATVIADTELSVDVVEGESLHNLIASVPGFATRFYNSTSLLLSQRLQTATRLAATSIGANRRQMSREPLTGHRQAEAPPAPIAELERSYRETLQQVHDECLTQDGVPGSQAESRVEEACTGLHAAITAAGDSAAPHSREQRAHLYRECFRFFMLSRIHDHAHIKRLGISMGHTMLRWIRLREADGDGPLGRLIDRWVLELPFMESVRSRGRLLAQSVLRHTRDWRGTVPMPLIYVGTGTAEELLDLVLDDGAPSLHISCIENEPQSVDVPTRRLKELGRTDRLSCVHADPTLLPAGGGIRLSGQKVVCSSSILDRLSDDDTVEFLDWAYDCLAPSGVLVVCQTHRNNPDRVYLEHILGWTVRHRDEEELRALFTRSAFGADTAEFESHVGGVLLIAVARRTQ